MSTRIEQVRSLEDPAKVFQYRLTISPLPSVIAGITSEELNLRVNSVDLPGFTIEQTQVTYAGGWTVNYPGRRVWDYTWNTEITEAISGKVYKALRTWAALCYNPETGLAAPSSLVKSTGLIELLDGDGKVTMSTRIQGIFPQQVASVSLDRASSEAVRIPVTWSFDYIPDLI